MSIKQIVVVKITGYCRKFREDEVEKEGENDPFNIVFRSLFGEHRTKQWTFIKIELIKAKAGRPKLVMHEA